MGNDGSLAPVALFRGTRRACDELCLVLDATAVPYELANDGAAWVLSVDPVVAIRARDELERYAVERASLAKRQRERNALQPRRPFGGAAAGATGFALVLLIVAYCAGDSVMGVDWLTAGALQAPKSGHPDWWRAVTALTLHLDPGHLVGNLAFGVAGGALCTRLFGVGIGWLGILTAGALANYVEMWVAPAGHIAIGASTAVFASVGLLCGYAWRQRLTLRERWLYRWTPLIGGVALLAFLGSGGEHVDVLGHLLGFVVGVLLGFGFALAGIPRSRRAAPQNAAAGAAALILMVSWGAVLLSTAALY